MPLEHINQIIAYVDCTKNIFELDLFDLQFITVVFFIKCIFMTTVVKTMVEERRAFSFSFPFFSFFFLFVCLFVFALVIAILSFLL